MVAIDRTHLRMNAVDFDRTSIAGAFAGIPVANIGDAMDRLGMCHAGIRPMWPGARCTGVAFTVTVRAGDNAGIHAALDYLRAGDVLVVNGEGDLTRALVGDILANKFVSLGVQGLVVDGCIRDRAAIERLQFPVWARGVCPAGPFKNGPAVLGEAAAIGNVVVHSGDVIAADDDGVVVIPGERAPQILTATHEVVQRELAMFAELNPSTGS